MKINLGSGNRKKEGWVNCDIDINMKPDRIMNINEKWGFRNESVDEINADFLIEHIQNLDLFISECQRVLKRGGVCRITTANYSFWRNRIKFMLGKFSETTAFSIWHCWLFKPSVLADMFRAKDFKVDIKGKGLLPIPDIFYYKFELVCRKRQ